MALCCRFIKDMVSHLQGFTFFSILETTRLSFCNKPEVQAGHAAPLSSKWQRSPTAAWFLCTPHRSWNENVGGGAQSQFSSQSLFSTGFPAPFDVEGFEGVLGEQVATKPCAFNAAFHHGRVLNIQVSLQTALRYRNKGWPQYSQDRREGMGHCSQQAGWCSWSK